MYKNLKRNTFLTCMAALLLLLISACYIRFGGHAITAPKILLADIFCFLLLAILYMAVTLRNIMKVTLYSYKNISLVGCILFAALLAAVVLRSLVCLPDDTASYRTVYQIILGFPQRFSFYAAIGILCVSFLVGISNIALIRHEGFRPTNALSLLVAGFYIGGTVLVYLVNELLTRKLFIPRGYFTDPLFLVLHTVIPLFFLLLLCYFECILAGSAIMGWVAARQKPDYDKDYIIILGCSIDKRGGLLPLLKGRVNRAIRFAWEQEIATGKPLKYVPSGGQGANEIMSEGSAMELYLKTRGAEDDEVFPERASVNTWENMCLSKKIIDELNPNAKVAFATTNYHMLRSGILAREAGLNAQGIAGDTKWYFWPNGFVREFFGILALKVQAHVIVAAILAALCAALGFIGYYGNLI